MTATSEMIMVDVSFDGRWNLIDISERDYRVYADLLISDGCSSYHIGHSVVSVRMSMLF